MPVEDHPVHPSVQHTQLLAGCHSKSREVSGYWAQDGFSLHGRSENKYGITLFKFIPHQMSKLCRQIMDLPECAGCVAEKDVDYINKMKELI